MKAVLVIDKIPTKCEECPCSTIESETSGEVVFFCDAIPYQYIKEEHMTDRKPSWCPLKPIPEEKEYYHEEDIMSELLVHSYRKGWNDCLKEILKDD